MGCSLSALERAVTLEYDRIVAEDGGGKDFLTLGNILQVHPPQGAVSLDRLTILFALDHDRDGCFSLEDLLKFSRACYALAPSMASSLPADFQARLRAQCAWTMHSAKCEEVCAWVEAVVVAEDLAVGEPPPQAPGPALIGRDALDVMFRVLGVREASGLSFQGFLDLLQQAGEEATGLALLPLEEESLDDFVPLSVLRVFISDWVKSYGETLDSLGERGRG